MQSQWPVLEKVSAPCPVPRYPFIGTSLDHPLPPEFGASLLYPSIFHCAIIESLDSGFRLPGLESPLLFVSNKSLIHPQMEKRNDQDTVL